MARARNIKPAFFTDEVIADNDPLGRLLYMGLWTIADFNGNLEWRPKRIKIQLLPYDDCDLEKLANNLDKSRLVTFYSVSDKKYLHIENFSKHQNPHPNERKKGSDIPLMSQVTDSNSVTINHDLSRQEREQDVSDRADSLLSDSLKTTTLSTKEKRLSSLTAVDEEFKPDQKIIERAVLAGVPKELTESQDEIIKFIY